MGKKGPAEVIPVRNSSRYDSKPNGALSPPAEQRGVISNGVKEKKVIKTTCKSCHGGCGVLVTVEDGTITHIEGNPDTPTQGTMCAKGLSSIQHIGHPDRLKYPLRRAGARGEGKWEKISWQEALDEIAQKMKESMETLH